MMDMEIRMDLVERKKRIGRDVRIDERLTKDGEKDRTEEQRRRAVGGRKRKARKMEGDREKRGKEKWIDGGKAG